MYLRKISFAVIIIFTVASLLSCRPSYRKRPISYHRLGPLSDFTQPEIELDKHNLLLRRDDDGFYIMSTVCTYDLTYLQRQNIEGKQIYVSSYSDSKYDLEGNVLSGPSVRHLPYYELKIDAATYDGPKDTLYAYVGREVPKTWRLKIE